MRPRAVLPTSALLAALLMTLAASAFDSPTEAAPPEPAVTITVDASSTTTWAAVDLQRDTARLLQVADRATSTAWDSRSRQRR